MAKLSVVSTPIGNLEDISNRAVRTLREADLVLCEDTRVTKKLLAHYDITTPTLSYHAHSGGTKLEKILTHLSEGKHLALVTDAGTPGISDPGGELIAAVRSRLPEVSIEAIPGPSALSAALAVAGIPCSTFVFYGFLPHKKGRETLFGEIAESSRCAVFFESPHRLVKTLEALAKRMDDRPVVVARELTKLHESVRVGSAAELLAHYRNHADEVRGEVVIIVSPKR